MCVDSRRKSHAGWIKGDGGGGGPGKAGAKGDGSRSDPSKKPEEKKG